MALPRVVLWLHEKSLPPDERDAVLGDLIEEFDERSSDWHAARRWLWAQTLRSLLPNFRRRLFRPRSPAASTLSKDTSMLRGVLIDVRFALRLFRRQPLASLVGCVSLAAGLGLNILLVTLADAILFRPLPLRDPANLVVMLGQRESRLNHNFSYPDYIDLRDQADALDSLVAYGAAGGTLAGREGATPVDGEVVSGNFFRALGVPLRTGRALSEDDDRPAAPPAAVISEALWRDRLGAPSLTNLVVTLNGQPYTVVGIAASRFSGMQVGKRATFWVPLAHARPLLGEDYLPRRTASWLTLVGRLRPGASIDSTRQALDAVCRRVREATGRKPEPIVLTAGARGDSMLSAMLVSPMSLLLAAGALVLLVACLNVANLQLARAEARRLELAVRSALGARRGQLIRLVIIDALLISLAAGGAGLLLAIAFKDRAASLIALFGQPVSLTMPVDVRVAGGALILTLIAAAIVGGLSTWHILWRAADTIADGRAATATRRPAQRLLVVAQVALSMALLTGAALLGRTLDRLRHTDLGFDPRGIAVLEVSPEMGRLTPAQAVTYYDEAVRAASTVPGVQTAAVSHVMPLAFGGSRMTVDVAEYRPQPDEDMELNFVRVTPGYFAALGIPVREGRAFDDRDREGQPDRIVINETMARRFWPHGGAVGRFVRFDAREPFTVEVIGVVADAHYRMVREDPTPSFYVAMAQMPSRGGVLHVRTAGDPSARLDDLRRVVAAVDPAVPVVRAHALLEQVERNLAEERMALAIGLTLAVVALLLAAAGLYATMAFLVGRRTREIGVRIALGASRVDVRSLVLKEGSMLAGAGVLAGLALSLWVGHALRHQIYGVDPFDVTSVAAAAIVLAGAALAASWLPARRASSIDPVLALRDS